MKVPWATRHKWSSKFRDSRSALHAEADVRRRHLVEVKNGSNCDVVELLTDRLLWAKKTTSISDALALDTFAQ